MIDIVFEFMDVVVYKRPSMERTWPVVPRVGEQIELLADDGGRVFGTVVAVGWTESGDFRPRAWVRVR